MWVFLKISGRELWKKWLINVNCFFFLYYCFSFLLLQLNPMFVFSFYYVFLFCVFVYFCFCFCFWPVGWRLVCNIKVWWLLIAISCLEDLINPLFVIVCERLLNGIDNKLQLYIQTSSFFIFPLLCLKRRIIGIFL